MTQTRTEEVESVHLTEEMFDQAVALVSLAFVKSGVEIEDRDARLVDITVLVPVLVADIIEDASRHETIATVLGLALEEGLQSFSARLDAQGKLEPALKSLVHRGIIEKTEKGDSNT
jgi:hypothetical protein